MATTSGNSVTNESDHQHALEEYEQALQYLRHDDQQAWTIIGLSSTLALALWAYALKDASVWSLRSLLATGMGAFALILGRLMAWRITAHTESRRQCAIKLEEVLRFELVTKMHERMPRTCAPSVNCTLHAIAWAVGIGWVAYLAVYLAR